MLAIKFKRIGKKGQASYRIIVIEKRSKVFGRFVEDLGWYNPHTNEFKVKQERLLDRLKSGARPSATVHNLLVTAGIIKADKVTSWRPKKKEGEANTSASKSEVAGKDVPKDEIKTEKAEEKTAGKKTETKPN